MPVFPASWALGIAITWIVSPFCTNSCVFPVDNKFWRAVWSVTEKENTLITFLNGSAVSHKYFSSRNSIFFFFFFQFVLQSMDTMDTHQRKQTLSKVFVVVIPKERFAGPQPANPSLGMATTKTSCFYVNQTIASDPQGVWGGSSKSCSSMSVSIQNLVINGYFFDKNVYMCTHNT